MMLGRRAFLPHEAAALAGGCQSTVNPGVEGHWAKYATTTSPVANGSKPGFSPAPGIADMRIDQVEIKVEPGMERLFRCVGFSPTQVHDLIGKKIKSALNGVNRWGRRNTKAIVRLYSITIATEGGRKAACDSVIIADAAFVDQETGQKIGEGRLGAQSSYRPEVLGGEDRVLSPQ
ncbi:MAG: hypothetical protein CSA70_11890 [Rhodobacterales bacterium]|nr:MAG: hypothetical protein CSA70_11890 [Rhodobacterales bacterium]